MFKAIDRWVARLFIPMLIKMDASGKHRMKRKSLVNYVYSQRTKLYRRYDINKEYIEKVLYDNR